MNVARGFAACLLLATLVGCTREQDYYDVARDRQAAMEELVEILVSIKDPGSMADAKRTLQSNAEKYDTIAKRANALPKPPPQRVLEQLAQDSALADATLRRAAIEAKRVGELPGGAEFLRQFQSTKGLMSAVQK